MKHRLATLARNPLVIIPPLVLLLLVGWQQYTYAGRDLNLPNGVNLLPQGEFNRFETNGIPVGWRLSTTGTSSVSAAPASGYTGSKALHIQVGDYKNGDINLYSPKVDVHADKTYLFKGYYRADKPFLLLVRHYHSDGSSILEQAQVYTTTGPNWSTVSNAFNTTKSDTSVQFVFRLYNNGELALNSMYLEEQPRVYISSPPDGTNLISNSQLLPGKNDTPQGWSTYHAGTNSATFSYLHDAAGPYLQAQINEYGSGEAKWQYPPRRVVPHQFYWFTVTYQSDTKVPIVAEYVLRNGKRSYQTVAVVPPADQWTSASYSLEVPSDAQNMFVSLPLQHNGTVSTRGYQLVDSTKPANPHWSQPIVSLTFDSGRQSQFVNALPVLQRYNSKATFYINPSTIETKGFMTAAELHTAADASNEIGARGYNQADMTSINETTLEYQLHTGRDYLRTAGFRVTDFAAPFGRSDAEVQYYARQFFDTMRGTNTGINTWQNFDPYDLKVLNISSKTTEQQVESALTATKNENGWLILVYQDIAGDTKNPTDITGAAFKQQMKLVHDSGMKVMTVRAAYDSLRMQSIGTRRNQ